ncbi:MAG: HD domain-containing phosphohydrolase [Gemmataceae bacterium]
MAQRIRLRGIGGEIEGQLWDSDSILRAGRLASLEVVLDDSSVSRRHAELRATPHGWRLRDLGSTNGTFLNGARVGSGEWPLQAKDIIRCGNLTLVVDAVQDQTQPEPSPPPENLLIEMTQAGSWDAALDGFIYDEKRCPRPGDKLLALLRASHHLGHVETEEDLLHNILNDAVSTLEAQRGAIVLAESEAGPLKLRAIATGHNQVTSRTSFSQSLAWRCFSRGESILCSSVEEDDELVGARSIAEGAMASVVCVVLRTPRKRIGVLHLDRGPMQQPFDNEDLRLADALAASVSAGIESAELLRKQRELFFHTIQTLAQAVELRDQYTGGHTARVTEYSTMLGEHLELSPEDMQKIKIGTPLHDIGKIGIDDAILRKPGRLTTGEFEIMKTHTTKGAKILEQVPDLASVIPIVRSHHERWDGNGYPDGLKGSEINRLARIVAVADAFDAMTSDRPYRKGMPAEQAFEEVARQQAKQFDPECAAAFLEIQDQVLQQMQAETKRFGLMNGTLRLAT